jgi:hypothetical protein
VTACFAVIPAKAWFQRLKCFAVIPAKAGLRRQDAEANIRDANGPKGEPMDRRVIQ